MVESNKFNYRYMSDNDIPNNVHVTSILAVCPMLASSLTHCCIAKLSCGVSGRMILEGLTVRVGNPSGVQLGVDYAYGFPYEMIRF